MFLVGQIAKKAGQFGNLSKFVARSFAALRMTGEWEPAQTGFVLFVAVNSFARYLVGQVASFTNHPSPVL